MTDETGPSVPLRIERGENASGMSQGTWIYRGDMMVWGHVASEGPMPEGALGVIEAIFGPADTGRSEQS